MVATIMERPETVSLTYDKSNHLAEQTLDFFVTLGIFQVEKRQREVVFEEKYKDRVLNMDYTAVIREIEDGWYINVVYLSDRAKIILFYHINKLI